MVVVGDESAGLSLNSGNGGGEWLESLRTEGAVCFLMIWARTYLKDQSPRHFRDKREASLSWL